MLSGNFWHGQLPNTQIKVIIKTVYKRFQEALVLLAPQLINP